MVLSLKGTLEVKGCETIGRIGISPPIGV